jgi:hypothetical protein
MAPITSERVEVCWLAAGLMHPSPRRPDFDQQRGPIRDAQLFRVRRPLDRLRDLSPGPHGQKPKVFRLKL